MTKHSETGLDRFLERYAPRMVPRLVFLFSGHMLDKPDRKEARFPAVSEAAVRQAIAKTLNQLGAGPSDIGLCGGACGGDLLFAETCLGFGMHLEIHIPFDEAVFLETSVTFAGGEWGERYRIVRQNPLTRLLAMPDELGDAPDGADPYERNNLWMLSIALSLGPEKVRLICLWDEKDGDGPGGTKHMHDEVLKRTGRVFVLNLHQIVDTFRP